MLIINEKIEIYLSMIIIVERVSSSNFFNMINFNMYLFLSKIIACMVLTRNRCYVYAIISPSITNLDYMAKFCDDNIIFILYYNAIDIRIKKGKISAMEKLVNDYSLRIHFARQKNKIKKGITVIVFNGL